MPIENDINISPEEAQIVELRNQIVSVLEGQPMALCVAALGMTMAQALKEGQIDPEGIIQYLKSDATPPVVVAN